MNVGAANEDFRNFDYQEFARQNNIPIGGQVKMPNEGNKKGDHNNLSDKPKAQKEFETEFFKMFNRR